MKVALALIALCVLMVSARADSAAVGFVPHRESNVTTESRPATNPDPQHYIVITGTKPADLEIWFAIDSIASNSDCFHRGIGQALAGSPGDAPEILDLVAVQAGNEDFLVKLPIDRYLPGKCGWHATSVNEGTFMRGLGRAPAASTSMNNIAESGFKEVHSERDCHLTYDDYWKRTFIFCGYGRHKEGWVQLSRSGATLNLRYMMSPPPSEKR